MKTLSQWLPREAREYPELASLLDSEVVLDFDARNVPWIGTHKNVLNWCVVRTGTRHKAVGWNENVAIGWSFPVVHVNGTLLHNLKETPELAAYWHRNRKRKNA